MKKFIKILPIFICGIIMGAVGINGVFASGGIKTAVFNANRVIFDGRELDLMGTPMISVVKEGEVNASNYMPVKPVLEQIGYAVEWDAEANAARITSVPVDGINYFRYDFGGFGSEQGEIEIWSENGKTFLEIASGFFGFLDVYAEVNADIFDELYKFIKDGAVYQWNGFDDYEEVYDGYGFDLKMQYKGETIQSNGYGKLPDNYEVGHDELIAFFTEYIERPAKRILSADDISSVNVWTKEFVYELSYAEIQTHNDYLCSVSIHKTEDYGASFSNSDFEETYIHIEDDNNDAFNYKAADFIRYRIEYYNYKNEIPEEGSDGQLYFGYDPCKTLSSHYSGTSLTDHELEWYSATVLEALRLPQDFDLNRLFDDEQYKDWVYTR